MGHETRSVQALRLMDRGYFHDERVVYNGMPLRGCEKFCCAWPFIVARSLKSKQHRYWPCANEKPRTPSKVHRFSVLMKSMPLPASAANSATSLSWVRAAPPVAT